MLSRLVYTLFIWVSLVFLAFTFLGASELDDEPFRVFLRGGEHTVRSRLLFS